MRILSVSFMFLFCLGRSFSQEPNWSVYMANFENTPGSVILNMALAASAPNKDLPFVLITGVTYEGCREDGLPKNEQFELLYTISDDVKLHLDQLTQNDLVGTFTHKCRRLDYIYLKDTLSIRETLTDLYKTKFKGIEYHIEIKLDAAWDSYLKFLYPDEDKQDQMANESVLLSLQQSGDALTQPRQIDHWVYFYKKADRAGFVKKAKQIGFKVESQEMVKEGDLPYMVQISRVDSVKPELINVLTKQLRTLASEFNALYDGWESVVVKE